MARSISTALDTQLLLSAADSPLTITASGSIDEAASDGISAGEGVAWRISNVGAITAMGDSAAGIYFVGSGWTLSNTGRIRGGVAGVYASGGGSVSNALGGVISGASDYGVYIGGGAGTVVNAGVIGGGWLAVDFDFESASNRLVAVPGAVFSGFVRGGEGTLELAASGAGSPRAGTLGGVGASSDDAFQNFQTLVVDTGATWTLTGSNAVANLFDNGSLVIAGALPAANIQIGANGFLELASAPAARSPIYFAGPSARLKIDDYAAFGAGIGTSSYSGPLLENFRAGDAIDIANLFPTGATLSYDAASGLLQIANGAQIASLSFQTASADSTFTLTSDGGGGLLLAAGTVTIPTSVTEALVADTGASSTDNVTRNAALTGAAAANAVVTLREGAATLGTATASASGVWTFTPATLSQGAHTIVASAGGASASLTFTYDTVAPAVSEAYANGALSGTGDPNAIVTLSENGARIGSAVANASGAWTYATNSLASGSHTVVASETDLAGNTGTARATFNIPNVPNSTVPAYSHIVVVVEENKNYDQIIGNLSQAPYINALASSGALFTNFRATTHPSQPNYFDLYAGSTFGVTDDNSYSLSGPTLYNTLNAAGLTFKGFVDEPGGSDFNHDPWVSFPEGRTVQTDFSSFPALFPGAHYSSLPTVSYVIPGIDNDMHNGTIQQGDSWLKSNLDSYAQWAKANNSLLAVVWDESDDGTSTDPNNIVPAILYGSHIAPGDYGAQYSFENLLSTITAAYGLKAPNNAAAATPLAGMFTP